MPRDLFWPRKLAARCARVAVPDDTAQVTTTRRRLRRVSLQKLGRVARQGSGPLPSGTSLALVYAEELR